MRNRILAKLTALLAGATCLPGVWAHPGHQHDPGVLANLAHSVTGWPPLLIVLVVAAAASYRLWKSNRE